ncbi:MAG: hypothetical protein UX26_C0004G0019 [Parcubacteria group bacterium GW2011_GWC1_45_9]|nr:MAG: hypothetical protein UW89_C0007G0048 [Parcubacteria group bacterium GW2011_GWB1_45_10]KKU17266.1 MAG: hypothetical protein UX26_C0004G0019 [Parcubacteria group bacterium GW2011_GWC1_45_9]
MFDTQTRNKIIEISDPVSRNLFLKKALLFALNLATSVLVSIYILKLINPANGYSRIDQGVMLGLAVVWLCFYLVSAAVFSLAEFGAVALLGFGVVFWPFSKHLGLVEFLAFWTIGMIFIFSARQASKSAIENSIKLKPVQILGVSLLKFIFILSLLLSLSFWSVRFGSGFNLKTSDVESITAGFGVFYSGYSAKTTVGEMIDKFTEKQTSGLINNLLPSGFESVVKDTVKLEARNSVLAQISDLVGRKVSAKETFAGVLHSWADAYYKNLPENTRRLADFIVLLAVFVFWFGIFQLFSFVFYGVFWLVLQTLLLLKIIKIGTVTVEKETLTI